MFFDNMIQVRVRDEELQQVVKVVEENNETFYNVSHFVRCAVIRLLREYENNGKGK